MISNSRGQMLIEAVLMLATILLFLFVAVKICSTGMNALNKARFTERTTHVRKMAQ